MRNVYLDHQASTPLLPEALEAMIPYFSEAYGNASSLHRYGLQVRDGMAKAREQVAALINAESADDIIFTGNGAEAVNLAIKGFADANHKKGKHLVISATEHPTVLGSVEYLERNGFTTTRVPVSREGIIDPEAIRAAITPQTILVAVHLANHDIGAIQPIREITRITQEKGIAFFCDAVASAGWHPIDVQALGIQMLTLSPHRFYGPKGVGVLYRSRRARVTSHVHGGVQEGGRRAGTENVPAIIGAGVAAEIALRDLNTRIEYVSRLQHRLHDGLVAKIPYIKLNGP
ncbi:MAG TPA: cysteine desulfurase family protein, partial [Candidatus Methylacidiphilales bacterium]|nr:cysteine desulfurase family protein [Candidatus Methylacidiphilales bacterium]